jgi:hypothetical protein
VQSSVPPLAGWQRVEPVARRGPIGHHIHLGGRRVRDGNGASGDVILPPVAGPLKGGCDLRYRQGAGEAAGMRLTTRRTQPILEAPEPNRLG